MVKYEVIFDYYREIVEVEEETTDYSTIIDLLIDKLEEEGNTSCFIPYQDTQESGCYGGAYEDEYIIGGNHGLILYHGGNLRINLLKEEE